MVKTGKDRSSTALLGPRKASHWLSWESASSGSNPNEEGWLKGAPSHFATGGSLPEPHFPGPDRRVCRPVCGGDQEPDEGQKPSASMNAGGRE